MPSEPCHYCHEPVEDSCGWVHPHSGLTGCGTGDGSTAYPETLFQATQAAIDAARAERETS